MKPTEDAIAPPYLRIVTAISHRISSGVYRPGDRLPSESQFCAEFDVSPVTLRKALAVLAGKRIISAEKGKGTFVQAADLTNSTFRLEQITGEGLDLSAEIRLLSARTAKATDAVAAKLPVARGDRVIYLRSVVIQDERPSMYHAEYVVLDPCQPLVESQLRLTTLEGLFESARGQSFPRGDVTVRASTLDAEAAKALEEPVGSPVLSLEHIFRDVDGAPVSWGWFLLRGDIFQLRAHIGPH
jgi:GntR family transcriptional regulator